MMAVVVDTNVILVANKQHPHVGRRCILASQKHLQDIMSSGRIAIDDGYRILKEYQHKTSATKGNGGGDVFLKWLLRNTTNPQRCDRVALEEHDERGFHSFPADARLANFDPPDRKFVAVAAAHATKPPILQAADSKWLDWVPALQDHGITVDMVCPTELATFRAKKQKKHKGAG